MDSPRVGTSEISDGFLRVLLSMFGVDHLPTHRSSSLEHELAGSAIPSLIDSRIPGMDSITKTQNSPRLLDQLRTAIRYKHYSYATEKAYVYWARYDIRFHNLRHSYRKASLLKTCPCSQCQFKKQCKNVN